jgi:hypothetical protein
MKSSGQFLALIILATSVVVSNSSCRRRASSEDETPDTSTYRPLATPATEFEQKLKDVRDAHFQYVWVFTRLDGKEFTSEDSSILHTNAPKVVDWFGMNDKKKFIAGSNFPIEPKNLLVLQKRFKIEDYSGK